MTTLEQMLRRRPVDPEALRHGVDEMHKETQLYQLKQLRKEAGLTQAQLADRVGITQHRVSQIENGHISHAQIGTLEKYLAALGSTLTITAETPSGASHKIHFATAE